jgi:hypothetical protein
MQLRPARWKTSIWLLICAAIVALSILVITIDPANAWIGLIIAVPFGCSLLYLLVQLIYPLEWWELTPEGITSHALGKPLTTRWDDIEELAFWRYGKLGQKRIYIKTRSGLLQEQRDKLAARKALSQGGYHVVLPASQFSFPAETYFQMLQRYWKEQEARKELAPRAPALT